MMAYQMLDAISHHAWSLIYIPACRSSFISDEDEWNMREDHTAMSLAEVCFTS